jgi:hypothetical protein
VVPSNNNNKVDLLNNSSSNNNNPHPLSNRGQVLGEVEDRGQDPQVVQVDNNILLILRGTLHLQDQGGHQINLNRHSHNRDLILRTRYDLIVSFNTLYNSYTVNWGICLVTLDHFKKHS